MNNCLKCKFFVRLSREPKTNHIVSLGLCFFHWEDFLGVSKETNGRVLTYISVETKEKTATKFRMPKQLLCFSNLVMLLYVIFNS